MLNRQKNVFVVDNTNEENSDSEFESWFSQISTIEMFDI